jgi:membrane associated rhomboid family serine protease
MFPIRDHNPSGRVPYVTYLLLVANIAIFFGTWSLHSDPAALRSHYIEFALIPALVSDGYGYSGFLTSIFLHGGLAHLGGNMLFLFIFGDNIEDEMGHLPFALFYLLCGAAAGLAHYLSGPGSPIPTVGASGAIAGVMGAYLLLFPKAKVDILVILVIIIRIIPIPAWILLILWFGMQLFGGIGTSPDQGGVAYWAHAGGFVIGLILTLPLWLRRGGPAFWRDTSGQPPHPEATYPLSRSNIPKVPRR